MNKYRNSENLNETQFTSVVNELRKLHKNQWVAWTGIVNCKSVRLKFYNLGTQIFDVDGVRYAQGTEYSCVGNWVDSLRKPFEVTQ